MSKYDRTEPKRDEPASAPAPQTDARTFITAAMAHAMLMNKQTTSTIPRQAVEMAVAILKELENFYEK